MVLTDPPPETSYFRRMKTLISLAQLHELLVNAFAVVVNDTLYYVGYDEDHMPYVSDNNGDDYIDLSDVDGDIELTDNKVFFYVAEYGITMQFLELTNLH